MLLRGCEFARMYRNEYCGMPAVSAYDSANKRKTLCRNKERASVLGKPTAKKKQQRFTVAVAGIIRMIPEKFRMFELGILSGILAGNNRKLLLLFFCWRKTAEAERLEQCVISLHVSTVLLRQFDC